MIKILILIVISTGAAQQYSILTPPHDVTGKLSGIAEFICLVEFGNIKIMTWEFNQVIIYSYQYGQEEYPKGQIKYQVEQNGRNFTLKVNDLYFTDGGKYTCTVLSEAEEARLIIIDTPQISTSTHSPVEGSTAEYICTAQFGGLRKEDISPDHYPRLHMFLNNSSLDGKVVEQKLEGSENCYNLTQVQNIPLVASMHGKALTCEIMTSSPWKHVNVITQVMVLYSVRQISYTPKGKQYEVGTVINCSAQGNPEPEFHWEDIKTGRVTQGKALQITEEMIGSNTYRCIARNTVSGISHQETFQAIFDAVHPSSESQETGNDAGKIAAGVIIPICIVIGCLAALCFYRKHKKLPPFYRPVPTNSDSEKGLQGYHQGKTTSKTQKKKLTKNEQMRDLITRTKEWEMAMSDTLQEKGTLNNAEQVHWDHDLIEKLKQLKKNGADPAWSPKDSSNGSNLHVFMKVVKQVILNHSPLFSALLELLEAMLTESSVACGNTDGDGKTVLHVLVDGNIKETIPEFNDKLPELIALTTKMNIGLLDAADNLGCTPLHICVADLLQRHKDNAEHVFKNLTSSTNVEIQNRNKQTALHIFVGFANDWVNYDDEFLKVVKLLRSSKNMSLQDGEGRTALQIFSKSGHSWKDYPDKFLRIFGALHNPNVINISHDDGRAVVKVFSSWAIDLAYQPKALLKIIDTFISPDSLDAQDVSGDTMLHKYISLSMGWKYYPVESLEIVKRLVSTTNIDIQNTKGATPLYIITYESDIKEECPQTFLQVVECLKSDSEANKWFSPQKFIKTVKGLVSYANTDNENDPTSEKLQDNTSEITLSA